MAHFETSRYWESEKELPKISQSDFATEPSDIEEDTTELFQHIKTLEPIYASHFEMNNNKPDARVCNEIFFSCLKLFHKQLSPVLIYSEIIDFFQVDNIYFYNCLSVRFKRLLKTALSERIELFTFEKIKKKEEAKKGGAYTPSFTDLMSKFKKN